MSPIAWLRGWAATLHIMIFEPELYAHLKDGIDMSDFTEVPEPQPPATGPWVPAVRYAVTEGWDGPVVAGPYWRYEVAVAARDGMHRTWRMVWHRQYYIIQPVDQQGKIWEGVAQ